MPHRDSVKEGRFLLTHGFIFTHGSTHHVEHHGGDSMWEREELLYLIVDRKERKGQCSPRPRVLSDCFPPASSYLLNFLESTTIW